MRSLLTAIKACLHPGSGVALVAAKVRRRQDSGSSSNSNSNGSGGSGGERR